jgi:hypothetical protein
MEARSFDAQGLPNAKSLFAGQEALLSRIPQPRPDLSVWLYTAKGMLALVESDAKSANQFFKQASDAAANLPDFGDISRFTLQQRLAFTYIRLGDGATAERLARQLIAAYSLAARPDSPYVLRVRLNLAQAFMIQRKFRESVDEANAVYPGFVAKFGPDHELTMQLLATRAQSAGSLGLFDDTVRDDLAIYGVSVAKQGPLAFYSIVTLSDAAHRPMPRQSSLGGRAERPQGPCGRPPGLWAPVGSGARHRAAPGRVPHRPRQIERSFKNPRADRPQAGGSVDWRPRLGRGHPSGARGDCRPPDALRPSTEIFGLRPLLISRARMRKPTTSAVWMTWRRLSPPSRAKPAIVLSDRQSAPVHRKAPRR